MGPPRFVVQHHLARADHYDFRLEIDGVLVSWAVPKGVSMDPAETRLAIRTDDHDLGYATYENGDTVTIWDAGTFTNTSHDAATPVSAADGLAQGRLSVDLDGERLQGGFALIRTGAYGGPQRESWLLTKKRDR